MASHSTRKDELGLLIAERDATTTYPKRKVLFLQQRIPVKPGTIAVEKLIRNKPTGTIRAHQNSRFL